MLAFGVSPAREADPAGDMPKVSKEQALHPLVRSNSFPYFHSLTDEVMTFISGDHILFAAYGEDTARVIAAAMTRATPSGGIVIWSIGLFGLFWFR